MLMAMVIFSPWTFGGWPKWSTWTMNGGGYALALLYFVKLVIRRQTGFRPERCGGRQPSVIRYGLGAITILLLAWCLVSAFNARAVVDLDRLALVYKPQWIDWLPHSYDEPASWPATHPPFRGDLVPLVDLRDRLWLATRCAKEEQSLCYDVIDRTGARVERYRLPPKTSIVGFGKDAAYSFLESKGIVQRHALAGPP